jgi:hypothetical protein
MVFLSKMASPHKVPLSLAKSWYFTSLARNHMPDWGNQGGRIMARVCDIFGHSLVFLVPLVVVLHLVLNLVPVLVPTCLPQDVYKRYLLSRLALWRLKIIGPRLVGQERSGNAQLLRYGSKHLGQNFFFYFIVLDRFSCLPHDVYKHRMFSNTAKTANLSSQRA